MKIKCIRCGYEFETKSAIGETTCTKCRLHIIFDREKRAEYNRIQNRLYHKRNREKIVERKRQRYWQNRERELARNRQYRKKNKERLRLYKQQYYQKHQEILVKKGRERVFKIKLQRVELLGGKCVNCGYDKNPAALDIHHIDPTEKETDKDWQILKKNFDPAKYLLLCRNCHMELHHPEYNKNV